MRGRTAPSGRRDRVISGPHGAALDLGLAVAMGVSLAAQRVFAQILSLVRPHSPRVTQRRFAMPATMKFPRYMVDFRGMLSQQCWSAPDCLTACGTASGGAASSL